MLGLNVAVVRPHWTGAVTLRSADPVHLPVVTPQDLSGAPDMAAMLDGVELCGELIRSRAAQGTWDEQLVPDPGLSGDALADTAPTRSGPTSTRSAPARWAGPATAGRSSTRPAASTASSNLHVADASIMPTIPRANTNLPVLAAAERIAEQVDGA